MLSTRFRSITSLHEVFDLPSIPDVNNKSLSAYVAYLRRHLVLPCPVLVFEDSVCGEWDDGELFVECSDDGAYCLDSFTLVALEDTVDITYGIGAALQHATNGSMVMVPLESIEPRHPHTQNYDLIKDYLSWRILFG